MGVTQESISDIQTAFQPYIKTRDQVSYVRRVLALHLQRCIDGPPLQSPISLVDEPRAITSKDSRGLQREYLKCLEENNRARREFERLRGECSNPPGPTESTVSQPSRGLLQDQLMIVQLQQKQERLSTINKYLDLVTQRPEASTDFVNLDTILKNSGPLPEVPKEVVDGIVAGASSGSTNWGRMISRLDKIVLKTKLQLRREEQLLHEARHKLSASTEQFSNAAKLQALSVTRNELIAWIETELAKAGTAEGFDEEDGTITSDTQLHEQQSQSSRAHIDTQLEKVKAQYREYVIARKALVWASGQSTQASRKLITTPPAVADISMRSSAPTSYLLTPYLEKLSSISREQKGIILHKSHFTITLAKQLKETSQLLDHLVEESQLLPLYPAPTSSRPKHGVIADLGAGASEQPDSTSRVRGWVRASESAKIANLETVAERVEEGQMAIEGSLSALSEVRQLLGEVVEGETASVGDDPVAEDIWLKTEPSNKRRTGGRHRAEKAVPEQTKADRWSLFDGNLGLIGAEG